MSHSKLSHRLAAGTVIKRTAVTREFDYDAFRDLHGEEATSLFMISERKQLTVLAADHAQSPRPGHILISLVTPTEANAEGAPRGLAPVEKGK